LTAAYKVRMKAYQMQKYCQ